MTLSRQTQKVFAQNANVDQLAVFGTMKTGTPVYSSDLATLQSTAYSEGWDEAILDDKAPYLEEMNAVQYGLSYQIAYLLQEGIPTYDANTSYSDTTIVKSIENGELILYQSLQDNNIGHPLSNSTYWKPYHIKKERNIGEIIESCIPLTDAGLHLLDGALLQGSGVYGDFVTYIASLVSQYPNLFTTELLWQQTVTNYGVCGKFVYDSVNNTVRLPKITGIIEGTTDLTALGDLVEAGLPNITGDIEAMLQTTYTYTEGTGVFRVSSATLQNSNIFTGSGNDNTITLDFDASRSSAIYGNSSTVQPQAIKVLYYIVIATATKTDIQVDIDEIATDLNGKADVDLSNVNNSGTSLGAIWAMPSDTYEDLTLGASETQYTAPANGWFFIRKVATAANQYITLVNVGAETDIYKNFSIRVFASIGGQAALGFIPVKKDDVVWIEYTTAGTTNAFKFYYAKGSESEAQ